MNRKFVEKMMEAKACEREAFAMLLTENESCHLKELREKLGKECMTLFVEHATKIIKKCVEEGMSNDFGREHEEEKEQHTKHKTEQAKCKSIKVE